MLIHDARGNFASQIRIDENHVAEFEAGGFHDCFHAVERQIDLRRRIVRNLAGCRIAARHAGNEKPVVSKHARRSGIVRLVVRRRDGPLLRQIAHCNRIDLNGRFGNAGHAQHGASRRSLREVFREDSVHLAIFADVLQINLGVDHVLHGQARSFDDRLDVIEGLPNLRIKSCRGTAVRAMRPLPGDVDVVSGIHTGRIETIRVSGLGGNDGAHLLLRHDC